MSINFPFLHQFFLVFSCVTFSLDEGYNYFANYADDTTPYVVGHNTINILSILTKITQNIFTWFANNQMKSSYDKC